MQVINYQQESKNIINWIKKVSSKSGCKNLVIGLSGGVDSGTTATLATRAVGRKNIFVALLPHGSMHSTSLQDAHLITEFLQIPQEQVFVFDIQPAVDAIMHSVTSKKSETLDNVRQGNIMARVRMIYLFDLAKKQQALVCGTENKSEHVLGYFTRFGDEASDVEPIRHLYKTHVWELAKQLGLPQKIITKVPTAGLWEEQTDEGEFGFSYKEADHVLYYHFDQGLPKEKIIAKGIPKELVEKVLQRAKENEFKHKLPFVYK